MTLCQVGVMTSIRVELPQNSYQVLFGRGTLQRLGEALRETGLGEPVLIITNPTVAALYGPTAERSVSQAGLKCFVCEIPDGEAHKNLATVAQLYEECLTRHLDRGSTVVALGGGVIGDVAGFTAATYMRGIAFVQVPTTLLAQVDASVGGKVAIDHAQRKNVVGAFYQPRLVVADPDLLSTLPSREFRCGVAEVIKSAVIASAELFEHLERHGAEPLDEVIKQALLIKIKVVTEDPLEKGLRMVLNFGHTIGHGLEAASGYQLSHGEAISLGMVAATRIAVHIGWCSTEVERRLVALLRRSGLPVELADIDIAAVLAAMSADKKRHRGRWRFVLPRCLGQVEVTDQIAEGLVVEALQQLRSLEATCEE